MEVTKVLEEVKVVLELEKGQQTIPNCKRDATDAGLFEVGRAIATLQAETVVAIRKIEESILSESVNE